jgi:hypothetical protein
MLTTLCYWVLPLVIAGWGASWQFTRMESQHMRRGIGSSRVRLATRGSAASAVGMTLAALAVLSTPAIGATGSVVFHGHGWGKHRREVGRTENPAAGVCQTIPNNSVLLTNNTNAAIELYWATDCTGMLAGTVTPGEETRVKRGAPGVLLAARTKSFKATG